MGIIKKHLRNAGAFLIPRKVNAMDMKEFEHTRRVITAQRRIVILVQEKEAIQEKIRSPLNCESDDRKAKYKELYILMDNLIADEAKYLASIS